MVRDTQQYINGLVNKPRITYLDLNNNPPQTKNDNCQKCNEQLSGKVFCQNPVCNPRQLEGEITDLKEFKNLKGINVSNNKLTNLNFLDTLPNKDKLKSLNLFGNQIKEVDFAELFTKFPNLEKINLSGNPLKAKNLDNLSAEQFGKLINGIKEKKISVNSFKSTFLMDLLEYAQRLAGQGNRQQQQNAQYLQTLIQRGNSPVKTDDSKRPGNNTLLLVGGLVVLGAVVLAIGYLWGKKRKKPTIINGILIKEVYIDPYYEKHNEEYLEAKKKQGIKLTLQEEELSAPDYPYKNIGLGENPSAEEKIKYEICQTIARYKRENNLTERA
ncbi:8470_t:CDS:2, partial [Scutellospora calospora]